MKSISKHYQSLSAPVKASLWFFFARVVQKGIGVIVTPIFTRLLSTAEYGVYTNFNAWLDILGIFLTLRLSYGVFIQGVVRYDNNKDEYTSALEGLTTLLVLIGLAIYLPFADFWNSLTSLNTFLMLMVFLSAWATAMFGFWSARQRTDYKYRMLVVVTIAVALASPISGIVAVLNTDVYKVEARIGTLVLVELLFYTGMFVHYIVRGKKLYKKEYWSHALRFNLPLIPHYLSQSLLSQSDRIMIRSIVNESAAGIYGLAASLSSVMAIVNQSINSTLEPWLYKKIKEGDFDAIASVSHFLIALVGAANLLLVAIAPEAMAIFAPPAYAPGTQVIAPLTASIFLTFLYCLFAVFEFYFEQTHLVMIASLTGAAINITLNLVLIPLFGFTAAGYTTLIGYAAMIAMHYAFMRKVQKAELDGIQVYNPKTLMIEIGAFAFIAFILAAAYPYPLVRFLFVAILLLASIVKRKSISARISTIRKGN